MLFEKTKRSRLMQVTVMVGMVLLASACAKKEAPPTPASSASTSSASSASGNVTSAVGSAMSGIGTANTTS